MDSPEFRNSAHISENSSSSEIEAGFLQLEEAMRARSLDLTIHVDKPGATALTWRQMQVCSGALDAGARRL